MNIKTTYVCDGAIYCGFKPEGVSVLEERPVLYADEGYELVKDRERVGTAVWLKDGDVAENYTEVKIEIEEQFIKRQK